MGYFEDISSWNPLDYLRDGYQFLASLVGYVGYLIQMYGWQMLIGGFIVYYLYNKFIGSILENMFGTYTSYRKRKEEQEYDARYHKTDPDIFAARISAQQAAAQKLQEKYDQQAKEYQAKLKEKEEQKRQEVLRLLNEGGNRLGNGAESTQKSLRSEYNPLVGPGGSSNWRPQKKSKCGGGGCGK